MAKKKGEARIIITLECKSCRKHPEIPGVSQYSTVKNRRNTTTKLELNKYCKFERKHTLHVELK